MNFNQVNGYGAAQLAGLPYTTGKVFLVAASDDTNEDMMNQIYKPDPQGVLRKFATFTLALAQCVADRGDAIIVSPAFETALSAAELFAAETKGVRIVQANADKDGVVTVYRADGVLAQTADLSIFTVTGLVEIISIIGKVGTVIETQTNASLLKINPTSGADVDLCAALDITAAAAKSFLSITGTAADALVNTDSGAIVKQAVPILVDAGVIELECAASNSGTVKWAVQYKPLEPGARVFAA